MLSSAAGFNSKLTSNPSNYNECSPLRFNVVRLWMISEIRKDKSLWNTKQEESGFSLFDCLSSHSLLHIHHWWNLDQNVLCKCTQRLNVEVKPSDRGIYFIMVSELTRINSPDAQSSSSAPFSQSFSPSHLHDNETHLLVDPPQSNFSGGHVCLPVGRDRRDREITVVLWSNEGNHNNYYETQLDLIFITPTMLLKKSKTPPPWPIDFTAWAASQETCKKIMKYSKCTAGYKAKAQPSPSSSSFSCQSALVGTGSVWSRLQCV